MTKLKVKEAATARGYTLSDLQLAARLPMTTARRVWWSSRSGLAQDAGTLKSVHLDTLTAIAEVLDTTLDELIEKE